MFAEVSVVETYSYVRSVTSMSVLCIETQPHVFKETNHCNGVSAHTRSLMDHGQSFIFLRSSKRVEISSRENTRVFTELISTRVERARPLNLRKYEGVLVVYSHKKSNNLLDRHQNEDGKTRFGSVQ